MIRLARAQPGIAVLSFDLRCATPVPPVATGRNVSSPPRSLPKQAFNATRQQTASTEIPIASDARSLHTSRGFLPWRFAYAGPSARRATFMGPASANLHTSGRSITAHYVTLPRVRRAPVVTWRGLQRSPALITPTPLIRMIAEQLWEKTLCVPSHSLVAALKSRADLCVTAVGW